MLREPPALTEFQLLFPNLSGRLLIAAAITSVPSSFQTAGRTNLVFAKDCTRVNVPQPRKMEIAGWKSGFMHTRLFRVPSQVLAVASLRLRLMVNANSVLCLRR